MIEIPPRPKPKKWSKLERTAYHEAGHVVMCRLLNMPFEEVTVVPGEDTLGHVLRAKFAAYLATLDPENDLTIEAILALESQILIALAGNGAEKIFTGRYDNVGAGQDYRDATYLASYLAGSSAQMSSAFRRLEQKARLLLNARADEVQIVAMALLDSKTLTAGQVETMIREEIR